MLAMTSGLSSSVDHQLVWDLGYELLELWSSGPYCDVWQVRQRSTYGLFAWKQLRAEYENNPAARASLERASASPAEEIRTGCSKIRGGLSLIAFFSGLNHLRVKPPFKRKLVCANSSPRL